MRDRVVHAGFAIAALCGASYAFCEIASRFTALRAAIGPRPSTLLAALAVSVFLALVASVVALRGAAPAAPPLAAFRHVFTLAVLAAIAFIAFVQPFRRLWFVATVGLASGAYALFSLLRPVFAGQLPRASRAIGFVLFQLCVVAVGGELLLRAFAAARPSPLFKQVDGDVAELVDANRYAPGAVRFGSPCNSQGYFDDEFVKGADERPVVAMIGDSFAVGVVPHAFNFTTVCERKLGIPVHNLGVVSTGPHEYACILRSDVLELAPAAIVVTIFVGNDILDALINCATSSPLRRWLDRENVLLWTVPSRMRVLSDENARRATTAGSLQGEKVAIDLRGAAEEKIVAAFPFVADYRLEELSHSEHAFMEIERERASLFGDPALEMPQQFIDAIRDMKQAAGSIPLCFVLLPDECQLEDALWERITASLGPPALERDRAQRVIAEAIQAEGMPVLDLLPVLRDAPKEPDGRRHVYHSNDTHFNARGNRIVGEAIAGFVSPLLERAAR